MPDSILSSAFVRSVNEPTRHHTRSPTRICPCGVRDLATVRYLPIGPDRVQVQHRGRFWVVSAFGELNSSSFSSVLTMPPTGPTALLVHFQHYRPTQMLPKWSDPALCATLIDANGHLCRAQRVHPLCQLLDWMLLMSTFETPSQPHNACTCPGTARETSHGVRTRIPRVCKASTTALHVLRPRIHHFRNPCFVASQALPLHVIRICTPLRHPPPFQNQIQPLRAINISHWF